MEVIGLDIDRRDGADVEARIRALHDALWLDRRRSANGNLHYRIGLRGNVTVEAAFALRRLMGDDPTRIMADEHRHGVGEDIDILYDVKGQNPAGPWERVFQTA